MIIIKARTCFLALALLLASRHKIAGQTAGRQDLLRRYLEIQQQRIGFNGIVLVAHGNRVTYKEAVGMASRQLEVPLTERSVYRIASITKSFTAALVANAVKEGRLHFTDPLVKFFPALQDTAWRSITISQLLSHTAGLPHNEGIRSTEPVLEEIFRMKLLFPPGKGMRYSSPGYYLLACILENVYKDTYAHLLSEKILQPLHMQQTGVYRNTDIVPAMAAGYHLLGDSLIAAPYTDAARMKGSGDMYATAGDLLLWNNGLFSGKLLGRELTARLTTAQPGLHMENRDGASYGYGWFIRTADSARRQTYYHGGGTFGVSAINVYYPQEQISIVILSNVSSLPVNELWSDVEHIVFNEPFTMPVVTPLIKRTTEYLQQFTGKYAGGPGEPELQVFLLNDQLYAKLGANPAFGIYEQAPLHFSGKLVTIEFIFNQDGRGNITGLKATGRGRTFIFNKQALL